MSKLTYILGPHLMGPAASVWRTLPMEDVPHYEKLKEALLDRYGFTDDHFWLRFFSIRPAAMWRPCTLAGELQDAAVHWLKPETAEGRQIMAKVVLHQLYQVIPTEARVWVLRHRTAKLPEAVWLLEDIVDAEPPQQKGTSQPHGCPGGNSRDPKSQEGRARLAFQGRPSAGPGEQVHKPWWTSCPWEASPHPSAAETEPKAPRSGGDYTGHRKGSSYGPWLEEPTDSGAEWGKGPLLLWPDGPLQEGLSVHGM